MAMALSASSAHAQTDTVPPPSTAPASSDAELDAALAGDTKSPEKAAAVAPEAGTSAGGGQSLNPDLSLIADFAAAIFSDDDHLQTGGHDPRRNGFNLQALELSLGAAVDPYFRFDSNIVFGLDGVEVEEAYGTTLDLPLGLQARAGQLLTRFGRLNATHPHTWDFVDQPFAIGRTLGGEGNRGLGVELSWLTPLPWYVELVGSTVQPDEPETARSFVGPDTGSVQNFTDLLYVTALKQFFPLSDDWSLFWGLSAALGRSAAAPDSRANIYGTDLYLKFRPITRESVTIVTLQTEWLLRQRSVPGDVLTDENGYAQLTWRFLERWATAARYEYGTPARGLDGHVAVDPLDPEWTEARTRLTTNLTFTPTEFSRFRLQGSADLPGWRPEPIWAAFLAVELVTGAHGAHKF